MRTQSVNTKNSVKYRTQSRQNRVSVRIGRKNYQLPVTVKTVEGKNFAYLSLPSTASVFKLDGKNLVPVTETSADAPAATAELLAVSTSTKTTRTRKASTDTPTVPDAVLAAIKSLPSGYKLVIGASGPKVVKTRTRKPKAS